MEVITRVEGTLSTHNTGRGRLYTVSGQHTARLPSCRSRSVVADHTAQRSSQRITLLGNKSLSTTS
jgi:hypothetical protein